MPELTFPRTGAAALACEGELIAQETTQTGKGPLAKTWHEITLARAASGRYVLAIRYRSTWAHEVPHDHAEVLDSLEAVPPALRDYDPLAGHAGYPEGRQFEERQDKLQGMLQTGYYSACGRLLAQAGIVERV